MLMHKMHNETAPKNAVTSVARISSVEKCARKKLCACCLHAATALGQPLPATSQISLWEAVGKRFQIIASRWQHEGCEKRLRSNRWRESLEKGNRGHRSGTEARQP